jgi:hypothetical protein
MKTTIQCKALVTSLSAILGGALLASAAAPADTGAAYNLQVNFTNSQSAIVDASGVPTLSATAARPGNFQIVMTDGSGKIDGVSDILVTNLSDVAPFTSGLFIADVSGTIRTLGKPATPTVMMNVRGNGFLQDPTGLFFSAATLNFSFKGTLSQQSASIPTPLGTNIFLIISNSVTGTTNPAVNLGTFNVTTNTTVLTTNSVGFSTLAFIVNESINVSTNATNNVVQQSNDAFLDFDEFSPSFVGYNFGTPVDTNIWRTNTFTLLVTNVSGTNAPVVSTTNVTFNWFALGTNTSVETFNGTSFTNSPDPVFGLASSDVPAFISAYINSVSSNTPSSVVLVRDIFTNVTTAGSGTFSNQVVNTPNQFSNTWFQVVGTVKGTITGKKVHHAINNEAATLFTGNHNTFALLGSVSNGVTVLETIFPAVDSGSANPITFLNAKVVTANTKLWMAVNTPASFSGKGSLNAKKQTYTAALRGVGFSRGSSASLKGTTGLLVLSAGTNVTTLDNIAAIPTVTIQATNPSPSVSEFGNFFVFEGHNDLTNTVGTNIIAAHNDWFLPVPDRPTNSVPNAILSVDAKGKIQGQTFGPVDGTNGNID